MSLNQKAASRGGGGRKGAAPQSRMRSIIEDSCFAFVVVLAGLVSSGRVRVPV